MPYLVNNSKNTLNINKIKTPV